MAEWMKERGTGGEWQVPPRPDIQQDTSEGSSDPLPRRRPIGRVVVAAVLPALLLLGSGIGIGWGLTHGSGRSSTTATADGPIRAVQPAAPSNGRADTGTSVDAVARRVEPAVIDIQTVIASNPFSPSSAPPRGTAAGTGMILTSTGEVLTNNHVIQGASKIRVTVQAASGSTSQTYSAHVLGADPTADVALLQLDGARGLPTVTPASSSSLSIGQEVVALGNALGQGGTPAVTQGTISALGRSIDVGDDRRGVEHLTGMIQTDALIQPGDSGGPLVNSAGQVIGMVTAGSRSPGSSDTSSRIGFAITSDKALRVVNLVRTGQGSPSLVIGEPGYLGIDAANVSASAAARLGLSTTSGALVIDVFPATPAARLGISQGAVITAVDGTRIGSADALGPALRSRGPGTRIRVTWVDSAGTHSGVAALVSGPAV